MQPNILFVEDEEDLRMTVGDSLRNEGYLVDYAVDGDQGFEKATRLPFDLIVLDLMLPRRDGLTVCRDIRQAGLATPILMLTARGHTEDKVTGLKTGADDYVTKPFNMQELMARIEALLRRLPTRPSSDEDPYYQFGNVRVDRRGTEVTRNGRPVDLSAREFQLLLYFIDNAGETLSRQQLLTDVWGYQAETYTRTVDVHVGSLRRKLEGDSEQRTRTFIQTVQRFGYKFTP
jgi:two-component system, OmpR family, alkaline phosphatase synthesis response regulator PhoP